MSVIGLEIVHDDIAIEFVIDGATVQEISPQKKNLELVGEVIRGPRGAAGPSVITGLLQAGANISLAGGGTQSDPYIVSSAGGGTWGSISGTLSNQADLQAALNLKANSAALADVAFSGDYNDLSNTPTIPTGTIDGTLTVNELVYAVDGNTVGSLPVAAYPSLTELAYVKGVTSAIQTQFASKVDGPAAATDNAIARFDSTTGKLIQNSAVTISDAGDVVAPGFGEFGSGVAALSDGLRIKKGFTYFHDGTNDIGSIVAYGGEWIFQGVGSANYRFDTQSSTLRLGGSGGNPVLTPASGSLVVSGRVGVNDTTPDAQLDVVASSSSTIGFIVQGAASQSAALTEWRNSSDTVLSSVNSSGNLFINNGTSGGSVTIGLGGAITGWTDASVATLGLGKIVFTHSLQLVSLWGSLTAGQFDRYISLDVTNGLRMGAGKGINLGTGFLTSFVNQGRFYASGTKVVTFDDGAGAASTLAVIGALTSVAGSTSTVPITAKGVASQSANLQEWQNSSGTVLSRVASNGDFYTQDMYMPNFKAVSFANSTGTTNYAQFFVDTAAGSYGGPNGFVFYISGTKLAIQSSGLISLGTPTSGNPAFKKSGTTMAFRLGDDSADAPITAAAGTFSGDVTVPDEAYDATNWNGSLEVPTKNAIRDKIESMGAGGGGVSVTTITADTTVVADANGWQIILVDATAAPVTVELPTAVGVTDKVYVVKKTDTGGNNVTIIGNGSETFDGNPDIVISSPNVSYSIAPDGTNNKVI